MLPTSLAVVATLPLLSHCAPLFYPRHHHHIHSHADVVSVTTIAATATVMVSSIESSSVVAASAPHRVVEGAPELYPPVQAASAAPSPYKVSVQSASTPSSVAAAAATSNPTLNKSHPSSSAAASSPSALSSTNGTTSTPDESASANSQPLMMAYYPDWAGDSFPPEKIDFSKFDWIDFAFALPDQNFALTWDDPDGAPDLMKRLVTAAHARGKKVKLSVGGWTGSKYFSSAVSSEQNRQTFVSNIVSMYKEFGIDGIDIDWEYPSQQGDAGNIESPSDTDNYLLFLQTLREKLPLGARISAATQVLPFADSSGQPMKDVSQFASVLDWILIMNYDVWGSSSDPGPNAPLSNACGNSTQPEANAESAIKAWNAAGFPSDKIVLGVPSYAYISKSTKTTLRQRDLAHSRDFMTSYSEGSVDEENSSPSASSTVQLAASTPTPQPPLIVKNDDGGSDDGQVQFRSLVSQGALYQTSQPGTGDSTFEGASGYIRRWDDCSNTPFLTSQQAEQVITYDDPQSLGMKAALAKKAGLLGVNMFDVHGDTDQWDLADSVRKNLGLEL